MLMVEATTARRESWTSSKALAAPSTEHRSASSATLALPSPLTGRRAGKTIDDERADS
jgi:hypothetical protein